MSKFRNIQRNTVSDGANWWNGYDDCNSKKYYDFGTFMDFCGANPQDLMPSCCCNGDDGGGSSTGETGTTLQKNMITPTIIKTESGWELKITSQSEVTSDIQSTVAYTYIVDDIAKNATESFLFENGSTTKSYSLNVPINTTNVYVKNIKLNPESDENYEYTTEPISNFLTYYGSFLSRDIDSMTASDVENMDYIMCKKGKNDMYFTIPAVGIDGLNDIENEDEVNTTLRENAYDLIIAYDSKITNYEIVDIFNNTDEKFIFYKEMTIGDKKYSLLRRNDPDTQRNVYDTMIGPDEFSPYEYSFIIK